MLVAVESVELKNPAKAVKHRGRSSRAGYLKMSVMPDLKQDSIQSEVRENISSEASVKTDGYKGYGRLKNIVKEHVVIMPESPSQVGKTFPWVHTAISNLRKVLLGIHHSVGQDYMQNYIDEYCYKFNRRHMKERLFDRLVIASISSTYYENRYLFG